VTRPAVWVVGYLSLDVIVVEGRVHEEVPGGGALYAALGAAAGGAAPVLVAARGPDFPETVLDALRAAGVDVSAVTRREHPTRRARLAHGADGRRESAHYARPEWHAATAALAPELPPATAGAVVAVLTAMPAGDLARQIAWARARGASVVVDTSEVFATRDRDGLLALADRIDLFAPSREETRLLLPDLDDDGALAALALRCPRVVQKRGADGLALRSAAHPAGLRVAPRAGPVVDPTGAGDACVGALAAGVARGLDDAALLALGGEVAARAVAGIGPAGLGLAVPAGAR
jgi:sugar/nucleoside kinase (ribokinase family)